MSENNNNGIGFNTTRSIARELTFQALYQIEINPSLSDINMSEMLSFYCDESQLILQTEDCVSILEFANRLLEGTTDRRAELDRILNEVLDKRTLVRTTVVDRNILRLASYEILFIGTAKAIVIAEAIKMGKKFGDKSSRIFLNGVLDKINSKQNEQ